MSEYSNTACIAYPADYPNDRIKPEVEEMHSTIIFLGDIDNDLEGISKQELVDILAPVDTNMFRYVNTTGFELFGPENDIPVVLLKEQDHLIETRESIERVLKAEGIESPSEFGYRPHVTVDMKTYEWRNRPPWVLLWPAQLWYGDDREVIGTARNQPLGG